MGPISSAVFTFIGYKQTDRHTDRQAKFIYRWTVWGGGSRLYVQDFASRREKHMKTILSRALVYLNACLVCTLCKSTILGVPCECSLLLGITALKQFQAEPLCT